MSDPDEIRDPQTPDEVEIRRRTPPPIDDPTLGIAVAPAPPSGPPASGRAPRPLVTIGDSLTHGVMSGAIFRTDLSWPAQAAAALGIEDFSMPVYGGPGDGLPLNLESLLRSLERRYGPKLPLWRVPGALLHLRSFLDANENYWERGPGRNPDVSLVRYDNLGIYGWDLRDALSVSVSVLETRLGARRPDDQVLLPLTPEQDNDLAARRVLAGSGRSASQLRAASLVGADGVDTLVVALGANNALDSVVNKQVRWSGPGYDDVERKEAYNVWRPSHFAAEFDRVVAQIELVDADRVVLATVPHVTVAPIARGVNPQVAGQKWRPGSRYFPYYTDPWIDDHRFDPRRHRHLTHAQARAVDSAIDHYNEHIVDIVRSARRAGRDWLLFDQAGLLNRLAFRRFLADERAADLNPVPAYELPDALAALTPRPDTRYFLSDDRGRYQGGLFSLDGVHPTTIGYGIVADEMLGLIAPGGPRIDFDALVGRDTLIAHPPPLLRRLIELGRPVLGRLSRPRR
ncbi:MAG: hypothetical protein OEY23_00610 [Acidimicrobiia bacterium]|nr:hypothetical protein [Acidimicrobiia bacterium]